MKVLMTERFLPESIYSVELGQELGKYCDLTIFCKRNVNPADYPGLRWVNRFYTDGQKKWLSLPDYWLSLRQLAGRLKQGGYDVVHVQTFKSARHEMPVYCGQKAHYGKLVHTVHNVLPHEASAEDKKLYGDFYRACDNLIAHNEATKERLVADFALPPEKIAVIAHGAYKTHMGGTEPEEKPADGRRTYVFFGNIRRYKGVDILLRAVALLPPDKRAKMRFVISGKQQTKLDATDYRDMIRGLGLEDCVAFSNDFIPEEDIGKLFAQADAAVFPYRHIYASGAMLMAYTYGKPVIASDIPVFREETDGGKTGLLFRAEDPQSLADALAASLDWTGADISRFQGEIKTLIQKKYNWEISARKTMEVYQA